MSNVIDFLERIGQDAQLRQASRMEVELALQGEHMDPRTREAILAGDQAALDELLGRGTLCCLLLPAEEEEGEGEREREDEDGPSREDEASAARAALPVAM